MNKNTSITLGEHFDSFIKESISNGRYSNASEMVRAGLRLLEEQERKLIILKNAIEKGEKSESIKDFDFDKNLLKLKQSKNV